MTKCSKAICLPLSYLWNFSMKTGCVPKRLKEGLTILAQKLGSDRSNSAILRLLCLTSRITKVFESIIKVNLQKHLEANKISGEFKHGIRPTRLCLSQLQKFI